MKDIKQIGGVDRLSSIDAKTDVLLDKWGNPVEMAKGIYMTDSYGYAGHPAPQKLVGTCGPRYQVYQYRDVKQRADEALAAVGVVPTKVESFLTKGGASMRLRYTIERPDKDIPAREHWEIGEEFDAGIDFTTGHGGQQNAQAIKGHGFVTRLACKNGMRSNEREFGFSVKHFATERVNDRLSTDICTCLSGLGKVVDWFRKLHDVRITQQKGENILKNISFDKAMRSDILYLWNHADQWAGVENPERAGCPESYHLGNLYNVATQVLTRHGESVNIESSAELSGRLLDTLNTARLNPKMLTELVATPIPTVRKRKQPQYGEHHGVGSVIQNN